MSDVADWWTTKIIRMEPGQIEFRGQPIEDDVRDFGLQVVRAPEVTLHRAGEPVRVLDDEGPVVAIDPADVLDVFLGRRLARQRHGRIAGEMQQRERDHGDGQGHEDGDAESLERVVEHVGAIPERAPARRPRGAPGRARSSRAYFHLAV